MNKKKHMGEWKKKNERRRKKKKMLGTEKKTKKNQSKTCKGIYSRFPTRFIGTKQS
jgi:hypothetical protein